MIQTPISSDQHQANLLNSLKSTGITMTTPGSKARAFTDAIGAEFGLIDSNNYSNIAQVLLPYMTKDNLDYFGQIRGIYRLPQTNASVLSTDNNFKLYVLTGTFGSINSGNDIIIPAGTQLYSSSLNGAIYVTTENVTLLSTDSSIFISAESTSPGTIANIGAGSIDSIKFTNYTSSQFGSLKIVNNFGIINGRDEELDDDYKYRINLDIQTKGGSSQSEIRASILQIPGIQDVVFERLAGTFNCYVYSSSPRVPSSLLGAIQEVLDSKCAYPLVGTALSPDIIGISLDTTAIFSSNTDANAKSDALLTASTAAENYINNLAIAQELVINQVASIIESSSSIIIDIGTPNKPLNNIYIWRSRSDGTRFSQSLINNYVPKIGERIVVENISNPITITEA